MSGFIRFESPLRAFFGIGLPAYFKAEAETFAFRFINRRVKSAILACRHLDYYLQICEGHLGCNSRMRFSRNAVLGLYVVSSGNQVPYAYPMNKYVYVNKMLLVGSSGSRLPDFQSKCFFVNYFYKIVGLMDATGEIFSSGELWED